MRKKISFSYSQRSNCTHSIDSVFKWLSFGEHFQFLIDWFSPFLFYPEVIQVSLISAQDANGVSVNYVNLMTDQRAVLEVRLQSNLIFSKGFMFQGSSQSVEKLMLTLLFACTIGTIVPWLSGCYVFALHIYVTVFARNTWKQVGPKCISEQINCFCGLLLCCGFAVTFVIKEISLTRAVVSFGH